MDFRLSDEQVAMGGAVRQWMDRHMDLAAVREYADALSAEDAELYRAAADLGWLGVTAPEGAGGLDLGLLDLCVVAEALGARLSPAGVSTRMAASDVLALSSGPEQLCRWLAPVVSGDLAATTALHAPGGAWDRHGIGVTATADGALDGDAGLVDHAADSGIVVVAAASADGVALYVVETGHPGVSRRPADPADRTVRAARVTLAGVPAERLLRSGAGHFERVMQRLTVLVTADLVGAAGAALRLTVDHVKQRHQFGRAVGTFQAIQHELAELYLEWTVITHALWYTAHSHDAGLDEAAFMTSVVKSRAADLACRMSAAMVQFHGAIGLTWEHSAGLFFARLHRDAYNFGDADWHHPIITAAAIGAGAHSHTGVAP
ncbi:acyl-CoA dehydrogenase family protein [Qaidamihabitans albus]|uniref:acyl-CoA dehydrogenase family protein n=1 Tax=Qaidamihabitans albus TaxID=2795733 RepID=UPI0018F1FFB5|nr:acyl-CoA dehydrogenase family protein [Qaidamihabitans albus]